MSFTRVLVAVVAVLGLRVCAGESRVVRFAETQELFANPGQGWFSSSAQPPKQPRLPYSLCYIRCNWDELEPAEGVFNFKRIDDAIAAWGKSNATVSFRVMTANAHSKGYYCSPKWLFDLGCKHYDYRRGGGDPMAGGSDIARIEPDYSDPIYLKKHGELVRELGRRYDGSASIEFVDIGSYGIWGEWHTSNGKPWETRKQIIDMYLGAFKKTPLVQMSDDAEALAYALAHGTGYRRDGVGSPWHEKTWIGSKKYAGVAGFADQWKRAPVVFEWFGPYDYMVSKQWSFERAVQFMLDNHVTYINDNVGKVPVDKWPEVEKLARLAGYRFVLREIEHPAEVKRGATAAVVMKWSNVGVGKLYGPHVLAVALLNERHRVIAEARQPQIKVSEWLPGEQTCTATFTVPQGMEPGEYTLAVALIDPRTDRAAVRIAIDAPETNRVHRVSRMTVR